MTEKKNKSALAKALLSAYTDTRAPLSLVDPKAVKMAAEAVRLPIKLGTLNIAERANPDALYVKPQYLAEADFETNLSAESPDAGGGTSLGLLEHPVLPKQDGMPATRLSRYYEKQKRKLEREQKDRKQKEELLLKQALKNKPGLKLKQSLKAKPDAPRYRSRPLPRPPGM